MTVTPEQGAESRVAVIVSPAQNSTNGPWAKAFIGDENSTGRIAWNSASMPNGDPASLMLWGTDEER
jgi:hypothetical protein